MGSKGCNNNTDIADLYIGNGKSIIPQGLNQNKFRRRVMVTITDLQRY